MSFPKSVEVAALAACQRCCCICHKFCGLKMELHHIKQKADGGEDTFENCIPLCFDCHADMGKADPRHPKGKHYTAEELIQHRDNWYEKVSVTKNELHQKGIHPGFTEVSKQLSPDEIKLLKYMKSHVIVPTISIRIPIGASGYGKVIDDFTDIPEFVGCENTANSELYFNNMIRLGLLEKHYSGIDFSDKERERLKKHPAVQANYKRAQSSVEKVKQFTCVNERMGYFMLTQFGKDFCKACIDDKKADDDHDQL